METTYFDKDIILYKKKTVDIEEGDVIIYKDSTYMINDGDAIVKRVKYIDDNLIFIEGDNKDRSLDSRDFGWVKIEDVEGVVIYPK